MRNDAAGERTVLVDVDAPSTRVQAQHRGTVRLRNLSWRARYPYVIERLPCTTAKRGANGMAIA